MACGSCKTCAARCSNHPVSCGHAPSQRPSPMISQKLSEPPHNLPMKSEPALADLHRIPDATPVLPDSRFPADRTKRSADVAGIEPRPERGAEHEPLFLPKLTST